MTPEHCETQLARLTKLRGIPEDICEYFDALKDVPDELFTSAVGHALRTRVWFPVPAELRADCDAVNTLAPTPREDSRIEALAGGGREVVIVNPLNPEQQIRVKVDRIWRFDCDDCEDTGWRSRRCPQEPCGRRNDHQGHEWVDRCTCLDWNPTIKRRREAIAKYSHPPEKVSA